MSEHSSYTAFQGVTFLAAGSAPDVALAVKAAFEATPAETILIFEDATGRQADFDLRGTEEDIRARFPLHEPEEAARSPGRPRLGVVAREVTLLPRHWDWLNAQPGGASATLRKLVETARSASTQTDRARLAQQSADRFMLALAGNQPGYEEAARALYAGQRQKFTAETEAWPSDVRDHARKLAAPSFDA